MKKIIYLVITCFFWINLNAVATAQLKVPKHQLIGQALPDATLYKEDGSTTTMAEFRDDHRMLMFFWATWCPSCKKELQYFLDTKPHYDKLGVKIAIINSGEKKKIAQKYIEKNKLSALDMFFDEKSELDKDFGIVGLPTFFFIGQDGTINNVTNHLPMLLE